MDREQAAREAQEVHALIVAAGRRERDLSGEELERVLGHIARVGFDPDARERVRGTIVGLERPTGGRVQRGDRLPPAEVHYLRHVVARREWPDGSTLAGYLRSISRVIADPDSGVFVSRYQGAWQLGVVRESRELRGPNGFTWLLVDYRVQTGHWTTAHQLRDGLAGLAIPGREEIRWLR
jgi:hypothetical protein